MGVRIYPDAAKLFLAVISDTPEQTVYLTVTGDSVDSRICLVIEPCAVLYMCIVWLCVLK